MNTSSDKEIEYERYNNRSRSKLARIGSINLDKYGSDSGPEFLRSPYLYYEKVLGTILNRNTTVLDLCCGDGIHSITLAKSGAKIIATDISEESLLIGTMRARHFNLDNISFSKEDAEKLSFKECAFDVVTCVNSLSYVDLISTVAEVERVLKQNGTFLIIDSFNHNVIYRLNRYLHFLRGRRSYSTIKRIPDLITVNYLKQQFDEVDVKYFGIFIFLIPILKWFLSEKKISIIIDQMDEKFSFLQKYAFKIVITATKN